MAEKLQLTFLKAQLGRLLDGEVSVDDFLTDIFADAANHAAMCNALREYHRNDGGSPEVDAFEIVNTKFDASQLTGRFRTTFKVNYHFTCSDVRNTAKDTIDWDLQIDSANAIINLTGEEPLVRD
jgi:hypothetical protein